MSEEEKQSQQQGYPRRKFPRTFFRAKPVKVGDELDVTISEMSRRGDGLTRVQGFVIFVPNTKQGDNVKIKITQVKPSYAVGQII
ncbi:MAG: TRAM domain-containing protein [Nitrososphaerales archaeon]